MLATFARSSSRKCFARSLASQAGEKGGQQQQMFCIFVFQWGTFCYINLCSQHELPSCDIKNIHQKCTIQQSHHFRDLFTLPLLLEAFHFPPWDLETCQFGSWYLEKRIHHCLEAQIPFSLFHFILLKESLVEQLPIYGRHRKVKE